MNGKDFFFMILRRWPLIVISAIIGASLFYVYSSVFMKPVYSTSATMIVNKAEDQTGTGAQQQISYNDLLLTQKIVKTESIIMMSNNVLSSVLYDLNRNDISVAQLKSWIKISGMGETEVLQITVENTDNQLAADIANAICKVAPDKLKDIIKAGSVEVIDRAEIPTVPVKPNKMQNGFLGSILGLVFSGGLIMLRDFFDDTFKTEEDIRSFLDIPILTALPEMSEEQEINE